MRFIKITAAVCLTLAWTAGFCETWIYKKNVGGVSLFTKKMPDSNHSFFKGETDIKAPLKNVVAVFMVRGIGPQWVYQAKSVKTLEENNPSFDLAYWHMISPWPVKDRDVVFKGSVVQDPESLAVTFKIQAINSLLVPLNPSRVRIKDAVTLLTAIPISNEITHVIMETHVDPGGAVPLFLAEAYAIDSPQHSLINLRKLIESNAVDYTALEQDGFYKLNMSKIKFSK